MSNSWNHEIISTNNINKNPEWSFELEYIVIRHSSSMTLSWLSNNNPIDIMPKNIIIWKIVGNKKTINNNALTDDGFLRILLAALKNKFKAGK